MMYRTPVKRARGLGSTKQGSEHWWTQRVSALALIFLSIWFVASLLHVFNMDLVAARHWVGQPWNAVGLVLFVGTMFYHSYLGVQVVIEDYVATEWKKIASLIVIKFLHIVLAAAGIFAVLRIALGGVH